MANDANMHSLELEGLKREKQQLISDISAAEVAYANRMTLEKAKLKQINEQEVKNILDLNETLTSELRSEINNIRNMLDLKSEEIRKLLEENSKSKRSYD